jgi:hypothetical protein
MARDILEDAASMGVDEPSREPNGRFKPKKRGAPFGNRNGFKNGSWLIRRAMKPRKLKRTAKELRRKVYDELIAHLGGEDNASFVMREIAWETANDRAILSQMDKAIAFVARSSPHTFLEIGPISKLDSLRRPVSDSYVKKLAMIGVERRAKPVENIRDIIQEIKAEESSQNDPTANNFEATANNYDPVNGEAKGNDEDGQKSEGEDS